MTEIVDAPAVFAEAAFRPQPDGSIDPAGEAGWFLQRERERRGLSLEDITAETGIHESHLDGIEHGDLTRLPSRMEALKMVGIYGQYLGFDPEPLIVHYAEFLPRPISPARTAGNPTPRPLSSATVISFSHVLRRHGAFQRMSRTIGSCLAVVVVFGAVMWLMIPGTPGEEVTVAIDPLPTASVAPEAEPDPAALREAQVAIVETPMSDDRDEPAPATEPEAAGSANREAWRRSSSERSAKAILRISPMRSNRRLNPPRLARSCCCRKRRRTPRKPARGAASLVRRTPTPASCSRPKGRC